MFINIIIIEYTLHRLIIIIIIQFFKPNKLKHIWINPKWVIEKQKKQKQ